METISDILREMRMFKCRNLESGELELCVSTANYFADRIEAAHKREVAVSKTETTTADAAERETVDIESRAIYGEVRESVTNRNALNTKSPENVNREKVIYNGAKTRTALEKFVRAYGYGKCLHATLLAEAYVDAQVALSYPPRNCDICKNADEAMQLAIDAGVADCGFGAREMAEFLLAEAKGEAK